MNLDPIDRVEWVDASTLTANHYNPNAVHVQELTLLELSILKTGWIQPILASTERIIIDGFHRWTLALKSVRLREKYQGRVPVVLLPITEPDAMMMTIRINRAKGTHVAVRMSAVVHSLVHDHGLDPQQNRDQHRREPGRGGIAASRRYLQGQEPGQVAVLPRLGAERLNQNSMGVRLASGGSSRSVESDRKKSSRGRGGPNDSGASTQPRFQMAWISPRCMSGR